jgi:small subunit ribosomal protein S6
MRCYEHTFIARQDLSPQQAQALAETYAGLVAEQGGEVTKNEYWGLRNLAYRMRKNRKGHYLHLNLKADAATINEIERQERLSDDILRYLTVKVDELEDGPSVLMHARTSREERTRRHDDGGGRRDRDDRPRDRDDRPRRDETRSAGATPSETAAPAETTAATETAAPAETATPSE